MRYSIINFELRAIATYVVPLVHSRGRTETHAYGTFPGDLPRACNIISAYYRSSQEQLAELLCSNVIITEEGKINGSLNSLVLPILGYMGK